MDGVGGGSARQAKHGLTLIFLMSYLEVVQYIVSWCAIIVERSCF